ncbi:MAG: hypothetical protein CMC88_09360 [Flavobacteriaceae bacterium]|nr:hypothetical protein [Flavobacteriaceae bacterium]|tara:strand:- start:1631 stop:2818 length:1188 start_codon:yes stop_codon:yes gene_type:complete
MQESISRMKIKFLKFSFLFFLYPFILFSNGNKNELFSIITIGPYQNELYSAFGHSGVRYQNIEQGLDVFYNYGIFDFNQPNFYTNYVKGKLTYMVGKNQYSFYERYYSNQKRYIKEQVLNLSSKEKIFLLDYLENNVKKENRFYPYNYIFNNCSTKIRDVLELTIGEKLKFNDPPANLSYRSLIDRYLDNYKWADIGIDICLGTKIDDKASNYDAMFLPEHLFSSLENATVGDKKLVFETRINNLDQDQIISRGIISPKIVFSIFLIISLYFSFRQIKYHNKFIYFDSLLFFLSGMIGILILFLWFFTDHISTNNLNILWAFPLNILVPFFIIKRIDSKFLNNYMILSSFMTFLILFIWIFYPEFFNNSLMIFVLAIFLRSLTNAIYYKKQYNRI